MATIPNALNTHLTAEQVMTSFDNALTKYPATKSEVETARGTFENLDARLDDMDTTLNSAKLGIKYKGEVNYYADLPNSAEIGDAYTVKYAGSSGTTPDGTEYVWGAVSGVNQWINFSKDSYSKAEVDALLALKQNALSSIQLDAVNSGIDSTKVGQIEINENNISKDKAVLVELVDAGAKNLLDIQTAVGSNGGLISIVENMITITGNAAWAQGQFEMRIEKDGLYYLAFDVDSPVSTGLIAVSINGNMIASYPAISAITDKTISFHGIANDNLTIRLLVNNTPSALEQPESLVISNIMLCTAEDYAISPKFVPYRPSYQELYDMVKALQTNQ